MSEWVGADVYKLAENNAPRTCGDIDCQEPAGFYVHEDGHALACETHVPAERAQADPDCRYR